MSNPAVAPQNHQRFFLQARTPVRAWVISGLASIGGAVLLVVASSLNWPLPFLILGMVLMLFGLALSTAALFAKSRYQTTLLVERDRLTLINGRRRRVLNWTEVSDVSIQGPHLVLSPTEEGGRREIVLFDTRQAGTPLFEDLMQALRNRLDASRGYKPL